MTDDRPKGAGDSDLPSAEDTRKLVRDIDELLRDSNRLREPVWAATCLSCGVTGRVDVTAFRWNGERQFTRRMRLSRTVPGWPLNHTLSMILNTARICPVAMMRPVPSSALGSPHFNEPTKSNDARVAARPPDAAGDGGMSGDSSR